MTKRNTSGKVGNIGNIGATHHYVNSVLKTIDLGDALDPTTNLQGVAYDKKDDLLWLAIGDTVVAVKKDGSVVKTLDLDKYAAYKSNGICYDDRDDSLWILCASQYLLHIGKKGTVLGESPFNYADQDHLCLKGEFLYITVLFESQKLKVPL